MTCSINAIRLVHVVKLGTLLSVITKQQLYMPVGQETRDMKSANWNYLPSSRSVLNVDFSALLGLSTELLVFTSNISRLGSDLNLSSPAANLKYTRKEFDSIFT